MAMELREHKFQLMKIYS